MHLNRPLDTFPLCRIRYEFLKHVALVSIGHEKSVLVSLLDHIECHATDAKPRARALIQASIEIALGQRVLSLR